MLAAPFLSYYSFTFDNWGANPSATSGTSVVPGASNAEGSFTQIAASTDITRDCYWLQINVSSGATSAAQKDHLLDIGVDTAGGTSYTAVVSNIICGYSAQVTSAPAVTTFLLPIFIKSGSSVAVRIQGNNATAGTVRVAAKFYGSPSNPENVPVGQYSETIGTITGSGGVSFTPGNLADGSWVSLGTTAQDLWWWQLAAQCSNATGSDIRVYIELAYGDATNKVTIQRGLWTFTSTEQSADSHHSNATWLECYRPVPAGSTLYVRGRAGAAPPSGFNAVAVGIGG